MNVQKFLSLVREITAEVDVRVLVAMFRNVEVVRLLTQPPADDLKQIRAWLSAWKGAYTVLVASKTEGLNVKKDFLRALQFLGEICHDEVMFEEMGEMIRSVLLRDEERFSVSAVNAHPTVIRRLQTAEVTPELLVETLLVLLSLTNAGTS